MHGGRDQEGRRDRDEPADRRGPRDGQPAHVRRQPVRPRASRPPTYQKLATDANQPLLDHAIGEIYPPGSTYKLVTGSAVLADGKLGPDQTLQTYGHLMLGGLSLQRLERGGLRTAHGGRRLRPVERHVLLPGGGARGHRPAGLLRPPVRLRVPHGHRPARRGHRHRALQRVEDADVRRIDLPGRDVPGGHRTGLRRGHPHRAPRRLLRDDQRRQAAAAPDRAPGHRARRPGRAGVRAQGPLATLKVPPPC